MTNANLASCMEQTGHELGRDFLDIAINAKSQGEINIALTERMNAISQFGPKYRPDVVAGFAGALTPVLEVGIKAIREGSK